MKLIVRIFINAVAIWVTSLVLSGLSFEGDFLSLILVGLIFGLVNALIRPIVKLLTLPINILTLGLFTLVINALMLMLTAALSTSLDLTGSFFENFLTALLGAIIISIVSTVLSWVLPD
jgi:putative membrane protein